MILLVRLSLNMLRINILRYSVLGEVDGRIVSPRGARTALAPRPLGAASLPLPRLYSKVNK
jgi:hypothetical protein